MNLNRNEFYSAAGSYTAESMGRYTAKTFGWMFAGLLMTFAISMFGYLTGYVFYLFLIPYFPMVLLLAELGVVIYLSARLEKMSVGTAKAMFFLYAAFSPPCFWCTTWSAWYLCLGLRPCSSELWRCWAI